MHTDPDEIYFDCPKCKRPMSGDKALLTETINCPDCNEAFIPIESPSRVVTSELRCQCPKCNLNFIVDGERYKNENVFCPNCTTKVPVGSTTLPPDSEKQQKHLECPKCKFCFGESKALDNRGEGLNKEVGCPNCSNRFVPVLVFSKTKTLHFNDLSENGGYNIRKPRADNTATSRTEAELGQYGYRQRASDVRHRAEVFTTIAAAACGIGALILVIAIANGGITGGFYLGGALIGSSTWLYIIGQLLHIRANTEK